MEMKDVNIKESKRAAEILAETFVDDKGMKALLAENDAAYKRKLYVWFKATLKMQIENKQLVWGAWQNNDLVGVALISYATFKPSGLSVAKWTLSILFFCGFKTVGRTISHDQNRQKYFTDQQQFILEFIAVAPKHQGQGIGKALLNKLQKHSRKQGQSVWLETTKLKNVKIFEKAGYKLIQQKSEFGVDYYRMLLE